MSNSRLVYPCQSCGGLAIHDDGPNYLDNGTTLYCDICGGETIIFFQKPPNKSLNAELPTAANGKDSEPTT